MSRVGSAVGAAMEAEPSGEADELAEGPADFPADAEGAAVRAEGGVAVAVALPQAATRVVARAAPSKVRIMALEWRIIRLPRSSEIPRPLGDRGRLIPPSMESRPGACQTRLGRHLRCFSRDRPTPDARRTGMPPRHGVAEGSAARYRQVGVAIAGSTNSPSTNSKTRESIGSSAALA